MYFFLQIFEHFLSTPPPTPWYEVRVQRSKVISPERRGRGVGVRYMSSGVCFWIDFEFPEGV